MLELGCAWAYYSMFFKNKCKLLFILKEEHKYTNINDSLSMYRVDKVLVPLTIHENFTKSWRDYKYGFGEFLSEFWYGNEYIHMLTKDQPMVIRIELEDFNSNYAFAEYSKFR